MGPSPTYHPPEGEECETAVEHGLPLWAEPAVRYCSRQPRPSPMWGSRFVGARAVGPWVGEQKPLGKFPQWGNCSPESTYLPTFSVAERPKPFAPTVEFLVRAPGPAVSERRRPFVFRCYPRCVCSLASMSVHLCCVLCACTLGALPLAHGTCSIGIAVCVECKPVRHLQ